MIRNFHGLKIRERILRYQLTRLSSKINLFTIVMGEGLTDFY
jgi:hypothetical protein